MTASRNGCSRARSSRVSSSRNANWSRSPACRSARSASLFPRLEAEGLITTVPQRGHADRACRSQPHSQCLPVPPVHRKREATALYRSVNGSDEAIAALLKATHLADHPRGPKAGEKETLIDRRRSHRPDRCMKPSSSTLKTILFQMTYPGELDQDQDHPPAMRPGSTLDLVIPVMRRPSQGDRGL